MGLYELLALCALCLFFYWVAKYVKAAVLRRGAGPDDGPKMRALNREVERLHDRGQFDWALQVAEDTFRRAERALGEDDPTTLEARELLGACLFGMGRAGEALAHHEAVLERRRRLVDPLDRFGWTTQNNVAVCYMELGKEDQARETLQAAERMMLTVVKPDDPLAIGVRINLAACLARLGRAEESLGIMDSCLRAWQARFVAAQAQPGEYDALGWSEIKSGKLAKSIATASQARGERVSPSIVVLAGDDRVIVGPLAAETAIAMEVISEKALGQGNVGWLDVWFARLKACKALCLMRAGKPVDALPLYRSALSRSERLLGYAHPYTHQCRNKLGECLMALEKWEEALGSLSLALTEQSMLLGTDHPSSMLIRINCATTLQHLGRVDDAASEWAQIAGALCVHPQPSMVWLDGLGRTCQALEWHARAGRLPEWPDVLQGLSVALSEATDLLDAEHWQVARERVAEFHGAYMGLCLDLGRVELIPGALAGVQGRKLAALLLEELDRRADVDGPESLFGRYRAVRVELRRLALGLQALQGGARRLDAQSGETEGDLARGRLETYKAKLAEYRTLRAEVARERPALVPATRTLAVTLAELQGRLGQKEALVLLMVDRAEASEAGSLVALVVKLTGAVLRPLGTGQITLRSLEGNIRVANRGTRRFNWGLRRSAREAADSEAVLDACKTAAAALATPEAWTDWLQEVLWTPLVEDLAGLERLHLVTQGALQVIDEAFVPPESGAELAIATLRVSTHVLPYEHSCPAGLALANYPGLVYYHWLRHRDGAPTEALSTNGVLAVQVYGAEESGQPIPLVAVESAVLKRVWSAGTVCTTPDFEAPETVCAHLAGHGEFEARDATLARVWIGPTDSLGFHEVLARTRMPPVVFLSACVVGRSEEDPIEGDPLGLVGALFLRGTRYCIGSLQPVSDLYMPILVTLFYQGWCGEGLAPARALAEARRRLQTGDWYPDTEKLLRDAYPPVLGAWIERVAREGSDEALCLLASDWYPLVAQDDVGAIRRWFADRARREEAVEELVDSLVAERANLPINDLVAWVRGFGLGH